MGKEICRPPFKSGPLTAYADILESTNSPPASQDVAPVFSDQYPIPYSPSSEQSTSLMLTPDTTPRSDPFADLFDQTNYKEDSSATTTALPSFSSSTSIIATAPEHLSFDEDRSITSYFNFFLTGFSQCFPYVNFFPWTAGALFSSSNHNPALRESLLAVAAMISDRGANGEAEALEHIERALQLLRNRLSAIDLDIDDGSAISTFLLAHFSMMLGDHTTAKKHLRGMSIVLMELDHSESPHKESVPSPLTTDNLTMLIWRMAIRIDVVSSIACGQQPVLPKFLIFKVKLT